MSQPSSQSLNKITIETHNHDDNNSPKIELKNLKGLFEVVSVAPANAPKNIFGQIKLYINGANYRLYIYDYVNGAWRYASLT